MQEMENWIRRKGSSESDYTEILSVYIIIYIEIVEAVKMRSRLERLERFGKVNR